MHIRSDDARASAERRGTGSVSHAKADGPRRAVRGTSGQRRASHAASRVMTDLASVLTAFKAANGCDAAVWTQTTAGQLNWEAATNRAPPPACLPTTSEGPQPLTTPDGPALIAAMPGPRRAWLVIGPCSAATVNLESQMQFLLPVVGQFLQSALEVEHAANELAERYEEINLLYTISEILGRTVALEEAMKTILSEVSETVGARRASVLVHDRATSTLRPVATRGADLASVLPIPVDDQCCVSAHVFRTQHPMLAEPDE